MSRIGHVIFFNDTATTEIYTLSLHDALPICHRIPAHSGSGDPSESLHRLKKIRAQPAACFQKARSEEHTSELQSRQYIVCRLLLEKNKNMKSHISADHTS